MLYPGKDGKISIDIDGTEKFLAHIQNWNVDMTKNIDETPYFGGSAAQEGYNEKTPGVKSWTASADGAADFGTESNQAALVQAYKDDTVVKCIFYLDVDTGLTGEGIIESLKIKHAADGKGEISISISGNGQADMITP